MTADPTPEKASPLPATVDCAIIGGGVSGLYAGWRLATATHNTHLTTGADGATRADGATGAAGADRDAAAGKPDKAGPVPVAVFELSERLGGRLDTGIVGGTPVEFGAMRYLPAQQLLHALLHAGLPGLSTVPFASTELRILYLRGIYMTSQPPPPNPYQLVGAEQGKSPFELLAAAIVALVPGAMQLTPAQWEVAKAAPIYDGYALYQLGMWNVLSTVLSNEAYQYVFDALGIESVLSNWNAGEALQLLTFILRAFASGPSGVFHRLVDGWSQLTDTLAGQFNAHGGKTYRKHRLVALLPQNGLELTDRDKEYVDVDAIKAAIADSDKIAGDDLHAFPGRVTLVFEVAGVYRVVLARRVILALPRRSLELVCGGSPMLRDTLGALLGRAASIPAVRIYLDYAQGPWWSAFGWTNGYSVTDLPVHQVFYGMGVGADAQANARVLMASYADFGPAAYWSPLIALDDEAAKLHSPNSLTCTYAQRQLQQFHQMSTIVPPTAYATRDWNLDPYGGAWHAWNPNVRVAESIAQIRQPIPGQPVFICGESYSTMQGWIEGALMSAEGMLQDRFGMAWPSWLPAGFDLGRERTA